MAAVSISQGTAKHKLELLVGERILPYNMTVYQAVKQFSNAADREGSETDTDTETSIRSCWDMGTVTHYMVRKMSRADDVRRRLY